jgi:electron transfer flavoprotein alpha subunit
MADILALVEHRRGTIRDITHELMACGRMLAEKTDGKLAAVILAESTDGFAETLKTQAHRILAVDSPVFKEFNSESYKLALADIISKEKPFITLIGHTAFGMDLAPPLGAHLGLPFTTDCLGIEATGGKVTVIRQMYDGKLDARVQLREAPSYLLTVRSGMFPADESNLSAEIVKIESPVTAEPDYRKFIDYIEPVVGDVDITRSDVVIGVGRGIKEQENIGMVEEFADALGGVVGCTRPVVDAEWLPKDRQIGSSGKTIKPKLYVALGISGAFQHVAGMKGAETIIAINKDPNAPIFGEADFGIVDDLFKVLPVLKDKIVEIKG